MLFLDELIRQVTINCAERGLLLLRVRDEIRMTIAAYQTLYESRSGFKIMMKNYYHGDIFEHYIFRLQSQKLSSIISSQRFLIVILNPVGMKLAENIATTELEITTKKNHCDGDIFEHSFRLLQHLVID